MGESRAALQRTDHASLIRPGGEDQNGCIAPPTQRAADLFAAAVRQAQVHQRRVKALSFHGLSRPGHRGGSRDKPALALQQLLQRLCDGRLILHKQEFHPFPSPFFCFRIPS